MSLAKRLKELRELADCHEDSVISDVVSEWLNELEGKKVLLQTDIDARDEGYFGDAFHQLIDDICHLEIDCGPNVIVRVTVERIEK